MISADESFLRMASAIALQSPCKRLQVGAVVSSLNRTHTLAAAFNEHSRECDPTKPGACGVRDHAEVIALVRTHAVFAGQDGFVLYTTHAPCSDCAHRILIDGRVKRVVYREPYRAQALDVLREAGIEVVELPAPYDPKDWLLSRDAGESSKGIWHHMMGTKGLRYPMAPGDSGDFGRCCKLLALFPEWRGRLDEMGKYVAWAGLVRVWPDLERLYRANEMRALDAAIRKADGR